MTPSPDVRYPVGRFAFKDPFRTEDRPLFLAQLAEARETDSGGRRAL